MNRNKKKGLKCKILLKLANKLEILKFHIFFSKVEAIIRYYLNDQKTLWHSYKIFANILFTKKIIISWYFL